MLYEKNTNTSESTHSEMGPVRQNSIQRSVRTAYLQTAKTVTASIFNTIFCLLACVALLYL